MLLFVVNKPKSILLRYVKISLSRDSAVVITTGYVLDGGGVGVTFPVGVRYFSLLNLVQTGSGAYPASYSMDTVGFAPGVKLTIHLQLVPRLVIHGSIHPLPYTTSWHSA
jgi:hypothetical protein